jgi:hypothetical protein
MVKVARARRVALQGLEPRAWAGSSNQPVSIENIENFYTRALI